MGPPPLMIISFLNPPIEGEIPGKLCITFVISLFPPGYVSITTAEKVIEKLLPLPKAGMMDLTSILLADYLQTL